MRKMCRGLRSAFFLASATLLLCPLFSCSDDGSLQAAWGKKENVLSVPLPAQGTKKKSRKIFVIDRFGVRRESVPLPGGATRAFEVSPEGSTLRLPLSLDVFHSPRAATAVESFVALGGAVPKRTPSRGLGLAPYAVVMLEIIDGLEPSKSSVVEYQRREYTLFESDFLRSDGEIAVSSEASQASAESGVLFLPVTVKDTSGRALSGINVYAANIDLSTQKGTDGRELPLWHLENYRPVASLSDSAGATMVGPIFVKARTPRLQIGAMGQGRCVTVTAPEVLNASNPGGIRPLVLESCKAASSSSVLFDASVVDKFATRKSSLSGTEVTTFLTNGTGVNFALKSTQTQLRPVRVSIEEWNGSKFVESSVKTVDLGYFSSSLRVELPEKFSSGGTDGIFKIQLGHERASPGNAKDVAWQAFYVNRSRARPKFRLGDGGDTTVTNEKGEEKVAPSGEGSVLRIASTRCSEGASFAALLGAFNLRAPVYHPCKNGSVLVPFADTVDTGTLLGDQPVRVFFRDAYGNESLEDPSATETTITVEAVVE